MRHFFFFFFTFCIIPILYGQTLAYPGVYCEGIAVKQSAADSVKKGFRGLSVVNKKTVWMSGPRGLVGRTNNAGKSFRWKRIAAYAKMDFRTLHAFDGKNALVATAGTPAVILRTSNGGKKWDQCFRSDDSLMFFDGVGFWNDKRGLIFGDPIGGRMFLMETMDGGRTWNEIPFENRPQLVGGEASFAASGTTIRVLPGGHVYIATGGAKARLWHSRDYGHHWEVFETPMIQGKPSQGIFSIAFWDTLNGVIAGGDYLNDTLTKDNCFMTRDGGKSWQRYPNQPAGYRSCVSLGKRYNTATDDSVMINRFWPAHFVLVTGPGGTDVNATGNESWSSLFFFGSCKTCEGANTIQTTVDGDFIFFCGGALGFAVIDSRKGKEHAEVRAFPRP